jgi:multidrug efflux pump subunit AcrA (membrane-fusion protein)
VTPRTLIPKLRKGFEFSEVDDGDTVIVYDPIRLDYFRFNPLQAAMLRGLDGRRDYEQLAAALAEEFEVEVPPETAERFVLHAGRLGLLDITSYRSIPKGVCLHVLSRLARKGMVLDPKELPKDAAASAILFAEAMQALEREDPVEAAVRLEEVIWLEPNHRAASQILEEIRSEFVKAGVRQRTGLNWRIPLFNPDRFLERLHRWIGWFIFSWAALALLLIALPFAVYFFIDLKAPSGEFHFYDYPVAIVAWLLAIFLHETAHGLTCKHFGGRVPEMGVMMFFGVWPAPYCDTSASYLFPNKRQKIIVSMAGPFSDLCLTMLSLVLLSFIRPTAFFFKPLTIFFWSMLTFGFGMNLNPFANRVDAYYAAADALSLPNLRERSIGFCLGELAAWFLGVPRSRALAGLGRREKIIFWVFGGFGGLYSLALMVFVYYNLIFSFLVTNLRGTGLVLGLLFMSLMLGRRIVRGLLGLFTTIWRQRRAFVRPRRLLPVLAVAGALLAIFSRPFAVRAEADAVLAPTERGVVRAEVGGVLDEILVREGTHVHKGDVLARLRDDTLDVEQARVTAEIAVGEFRLKELRAGARPAEIEKARAHLAGTEAASDQGAVDLQRRQRLASLSVIPDVDVDESSSRLAGYIAERGRASAELRLRQAATRAEEIAMAEAMLDAARAHRTRLEVELGRLVARSPVDGVVLTPHVEERAKQSLARGDVICEIGDRDRVHAEIILGPTDQHAVVQAQSPVRVRFQADPGLEVTTRVARVRNVLERRPDSPESIGVIAETEPFDAPHVPLGGGGHARIYGEQRSLAYGLFVFPLRRAINVSLWSLF